MMRSKYVYGGSKNAFDLPVAGFAALAVGFVVFAMPEWRFEQLVGLSGLPAVLSAAQPPLGWTARIGVAVAGAVFAFAASFLALRLAERIGPGIGRGRARTVEEAPEGVPIRRRRFDSHPDAPPRPPVSAARDFGEPAAPETPAARPFWLPDDFPEVEHEEAERWEAEREAADAEIEDEPALDLAGFAEPAPLPEHAEALEPEPAVHRPASTDAAPAESIAELMARLERGLSAPEPAAAPDVRPGPEPAPAAFPEASEDRLRSAIQGLRQLAGRA